MSNIMDPQVGVRQPRTVSEEAMRASAVAAGVPEWMVRNILTQPYVDYTYIRRGNTYVYDRAQNLFVLRGDGPTQSW
jgi:hypothetical protein